MAMKDLEGQPPTRTRPVGASGGGRKPQAVVPPSMDSAWPVMDPALAEAR